MIRILRAGDADKPGLLWREIDAEEVIAFPRPSSPRVEGWALRDRGAGVAEDWNDSLRNW